MTRFHKLRTMRNFKRLWIMVAFVLEGVALWFEVAAELAYQHSEKKKKRNS